MDIILRRILDLKAQKGITNKRFQNDLGLYGSAVSEWKNGHSQSYLKHLPDIAEYLGVPIDVLVGNLSYINLHDNAKSIDEVLVDKSGNYSMLIQKRHNQFANAKSETTFDNEEINLLQFFRKFNKTGKKKIMAYMNDICHNEQYMENESNVR